MLSSTDGGDAANHGQLISTLLFLFCMYSFQANKYNKRVFLPDRYYRGQYATYDEDIQGSTQPFIRVQHIGRDYRGRMQATRKQIYEKTGR